MLVYFGKYLCVILPMSPQFPSKYNFFFLITFDILVKFDMGFLCVMVFFLFRLLLQFLLVQRHPCFPKMPTCAYRIILNLLLELLTFIYVMFYFYKVERFAECLNYAVRAYTVFLPCTVSTYCCLEYQK